MDKLEREYRSYNDLMRRTSGKRKTFAEYKAMREGRGKFEISGKKSGLETTGYRRPSPDIPSGDGIAHFGGKKEQRYTGTEIIGIATMHKSNAVPVRKKEDAEDIARMRR